MQELLTHILHSTFLTSLLTGHFFGKESGLDLWCLIPNLTLVDLRSSSRTVGGLLRVLPGVAGNPLMGFAAWLHRVAWWVPTRPGCLVKSEDEDGGLKVVGQRYRFYAVDLPDGVLQLLRWEAGKCACLSVPVH